MSWERLILLLVLVGDEQKNIFQAQGVPANMAPAAFYQYPFWDTLYHELTNVE